MKSLKPIALLAIASILVAFPNLLAHGTHAKQPPLVAQKIAAPGEFKVQVLAEGEWRDAGRLPYNQFPQERRLDLSAFLNRKDPVTIRLVQSGGQAGHVDAVTLGGIAPTSISGSDDSLALKKLLRRDSDVLDAFGKTLELTFPAAGSDSLLRLAARIEPPAGRETPFQFPIKNLFKPVDERADFLTYALRQPQAPCASPRQKASRRKPESRDSKRSGKAAVDGRNLEVPPAPEDSPARSRAMDPEAPGEPLFKEYCRTGSGHPNGFTYGWAANDVENLYVRLEFTPDNTLGGEKDYATVWAAAETGVKAFRVSATDRKYGESQFTYTDKVPYQHKVYDFKIPLNELGIGKIGKGDALRLAFSAYGSASPNWDDPSFVSTPGDPYFKSCTVQAQYLSSGIRSVFQCSVYDPDGTVPDDIDSLEISGPGGFAYSVTNLQYIGNNQYWAGLPGELPAEGEYVFRVTDIDGNSATTTYYHHAGPAIPLPDKTTFLATGVALTPTLSWSGLNGYEGNLFYRVAIRDETTGTVWYSGTLTNTALTLASGVLQSGRSYSWRVDAMDGFRSEIWDHQARSDYVPLEVGSDTRPYFTNCYVLNRHRRDGFFTFPVVTVADPNGTIPGSLTSLKVELVKLEGEPTPLSPPQLIHDFDLTPVASGGDYDPLYGTFYRRISGSPVNGIYRFTAVDVEGKQVATYDYVKSSDVPVVPTSSLQASGNPYDTGSPTLRFSWGAPSDMTGPLYYDVNFSELDGSGNEVRSVWASSTLTETAVAVPVSTTSGPVLPLPDPAPGNHYSWKVRAWDGKYGPHRNRSDSEWIPLTIDNTRPYFKGATVYRSRYPHADYTALDAYVADTAGNAPDSIESVTVSGPNSFSHQYRQEDIFRDLTGVETAEWWYGAPWNLPSGVYTVTATSKQGQSAVTHDILGPPVFIGTLDETRFRVYPMKDPQNAANNPVVSWEGVSGYPGHLYYRLRVRDGDGNNVFYSSRDPLTAISVPASSIPRQTSCTTPRKPYFFRVEVQEDPDWIIYDSRTASRWQPLFPQLDLASLGAAAGTTIQVPITLRNAPGIHVASTVNQIAFDPALLDFQTAVLGEAASKAGKTLALVYDPINAAGVLSVTVDGNAEGIGGGTVAVLSFLVKENTGFFGPTTITNCPAATPSSGDPTYTTGDWAEISILPPSGSCGGGGSGDTLRVPDEFQTIQAALDAAYDYDTVLVQSGIYRVGSLNFNGKKLTVTCDGTAGSCILDGAGMRRIFNLNSGETSESVICGFTLQNGYSNYGGGIYLNKASPTFENCTILSNTAPSGGGGVFVSQASPTFRGCTFGANLGGNGGAVFSDGASPLFIRCYLFKNRATSNDGHGGAVYTMNTGTPAFENCQIVSNRAGVTGGTGGAIHAQSGSVRLTNCTLSRNRAQGANARGGAVANGGSAVITIVNSIMWGDLQNGAPNEVDGAADISFSDVEVAQGAQPGFGNINSDPLFVDPVNGHYEIDPDSPCIDRGDSAAPGGVGTLDLYGQPRVSGAAVDMGAFETKGRCYVDGDGDGYGNGSSTGTAWTCDAGLAPNNFDCNDGNAAIHPGAPEACDGIDNNCNGQIDEGCSIYTWYRDADGDGYGDPNSWITGTSPAPPAGYVSNSLDPDDTDPTLFPGMVIPLAERNALIALYNSTNGAGWTNKTNWLGAIGTECTWHGVICGGNRVAGLQLNSNNLTGTLPSEIGDLTAMLTLILWENQLSGTIPESIGNLTNLIHLSLSSNRLTGSIPSVIGNLVNLKSLALNDNQLTGTIPSPVWTLTHLEGLYLGWNQLTGTIPVEIGNLTSLVDLHLDGNELSGTIPAQVWNLTHLRSLWLNNNQLTGRIPAEITQLAGLESLFLQWNQLSGMIPPEIGGFPDLLELYLEGNRFTGGIPPEIGNLVKLEWLHLGWCGLSGSIPPQIGHLTNLQELWLNHNQLSGPVPRQLAHLTSLTDGASDFRRNGLHTTDGTLRAFLASKQREGGDWASSQNPLSVTVTVTDFSAGGSHNLSIRSDGSLWAWGGNGLGQLGTGDLVRRTSPVQVGTGTDWMDLSAGNAHSLALQADGSLWAWGANVYGQLGLAPGDRNNRTAPVRVGSDNDWLSISAGGGHSLGIKKDGTMWAWGSSAFGQVGDGSPFPAPDRLIPVQIGTDNDWTAVAAGLEHSLGVKSNGTLWAWGRNLHGQLGVGDFADRDAPEQVGIGTNWMTVSTRGHHSLALKWDGTLWAWGANDHGQLGLGDTTERSSPVQVGTDTDWIAITAGAQHSLALKSDGKLWVWGANESGQLGTRDGLDHLLPSELQGYSYWIALAAGDSHSLGLQADGTLRAWGLNTDGRLGLGDLTDREVPSSIPLAPPMVYYRDADGDGSGDPGNSVIAFAPPDGYVGNSRDPDDGNPLEKPSPTTPYIRYCTVVAMQTPATVLTGFSVSVFDPGGSVPASIASLEIRGPNGFRYSASAQNYWRNNEYWIEISESLPAEGEYTFEVVDDEGLRATSTFTHHAGPMMPVPDKQTFLASPDPATGTPLTPTLSWSALNGYEGNPFYRVRIYDGPDDKFGIWTSGFTASTAVAVPPGANLQEGRTYLWRVEAFDNYRYEISDHRANSGKVDLAVGSDTRPYFGYAMVMNRHTPEGFFTFPQVQVVDPNGTVPTDLRSLKVELMKRDGEPPLATPLLIHEYNGGDYDPFWNEFYTRIPGRPADGLYRFTVEDSEGKQAVTYDHMRSYDVPIVPTASMQASGKPYALTSPALTLSWGAPADLDRPLFYQAMFNKVDGGVETEVWRSSMSTETAVVVPVSTTSGGVTVPVLPLTTGKTYRWKVRAYDSRYGVHYNRSDSEWITLTVDNTRPYFQSAAVYNARYHHGDSSAFDFYVMDPGGSSPATIQSVTLSGPPMDPDFPGGFLHSIQPEDVLPRFTEWWYGAPYDLSPGVYTLTATSSQGKTAVTHEVLGVKRPIGFPDENRFRVYPFTDPVVAWDGIPGYPDHLFYRLRVRDGDGNNLFGSNRDPLTAVTIPSSSFPAQPLSCEDAPRKSFFFRVETQDHADWVQYDNRSTSHLLPLHPQLDLASIGATPGATVRLPITLRNAPGIEVHSSANEIVFEPDWLEYQGVETGPAAAGRTVSSEYPFGGSPGRARVTVQQSDSPIGAGIVASVVFRVRENTGPQGLTKLGSTTLRNCATAYAVDRSSFYTSGDWGEIMVLPQSSPCDASGGGATLAVPGVYPTIQDALNAAQDHSPDPLRDTVLVEPGIYEVDRLTFSGKKVQLRCNGAPGSCILEGTGVTRVFQLTSGETQESSICGFTIQNGFAEYGGGIYLNNASPTFENCTITGNTAPSGGGAIHATHSSPQFRGCTIASNKGGNGGAIFLDASSAQFSRCAIFSNTAMLSNGQGGAIYVVNAGTSSFVSCLIGGNEAGVSGGAGGALHAKSGAVTLTNCTLMENKAKGANARGGSLSIEAAAVTVTNSILWGNLQNGVPNEINGTAAVTFSDVQGGYPGTGNLNLDPLFVDAANGHVELQPDSPCIDQGTSSPAGGVGSLDFYGQPRISGAAVDMGAIETVTTPVVYTIHASAGAGGSISPSGSVSVDAGQSVTFTVTADPGYNIANVAVNGASVGAVASYTFVNVTNDGTIIATFAPTQTWYQDADGDGYGNPAVSTQSGTQPAGYVADNTDCNDGNPAIHPGAAEVCNGVDDNCDGQVDEGVLLTFYRDADSDGYGDPGATVSSCSAPAGYVPTAGDCNDSNPGIHPGAAEACDGVDNNCNGQTDEGCSLLTWYRDADGDGYGNPAISTINSFPPAGFVDNAMDCDDGNAAISPVTVWYSDADNDGYSDGATRVQCLRPAGFRLASELVATSGDCNDANPSIHPGAAEACDGVDNNCNGAIDEGCPLLTWYRDADEDGYGDPAHSLTSTIQPDGYVDNALDSDDDNPGITPNSVWYKDRDGDGYSDGQSLQQGSRPAGYALASELTALAGDCDDADATRHPGATEVCDAIDNNCNGLADEGISCLITAQALQVPSDPVTGDPIPVIAGEPLWVTATFRNNTGEPIRTILPDCFNTTFTLMDADGNILPPLDRVRAPYSIPEDVVTLPPGDFFVTCNVAELYRHEVLEAGEYTVEATYSNTVADPDLEPNGDCRNPPCEKLWTGAAASPPAPITIAPVPAVQTLNAEVAFTPSQWNVQWGMVPGLTITAVLGNIPGHSVNEVDLTPDAVKLNGIPATSTVFVATIPATLVAEFDAFAAVRGLGTTFDGTVFYPTLECRLMTTGDIVLAKAPVSLFEQPAPIFYRDADGDGYGDAGSGVPAWSAPPEYVSNNEDSNDADPDINPTTTWYKDADGDGYSDGTTLTQGTQPAGYVLPGALVATSGDCDDADGRIHPATVWHKDADRDGYPGGPTLTQCARPAGYRLLDELVSLTVDCNDADALIHPGAVEVCDGKDNDCGGVADDVAGNLCSQFHETLTVPAAAVRPGEPLWVTATFINSSDQPIKTIRPDCYNTTFTVQDASGAILPPLDRVRIPYDIPGDIVTLAPGSFSVTCDLTEMYRPEVLSSGEAGEPVTYTVQAAYSNTVRDPDLDRSGRCTRPDGLCFPLWEGAVASTTASPVTLEGALLARTVSEITFDPAFWPAEWALSTGRRITATITNAAGVDPGSIRLNGSVPIIPGSASLSGGVLTVQFDAAQAVKTLGPPWPPALGMVYPTVEGEGLAELVSGKKAVRLTLAGDLDGDGDIDSDDVNILLKYRSKPASTYPECDLDRDGIITVLDARKLVLLCTRTNCATR